MDDQNYKDYIDTFNDLKKNIQNDDLYFAYAKKRKKYLDEIKDKQNFVLSQKLLLCAMATDVAMNTYLDYSASIAKAMNELGKELNEHNARYKQVDKIHFAQLESSKNKLFAAMKETTDVPLVQELMGDFHATIAKMETRLKVTNDIEGFILFKSATYNIITVYVHSTLLEMFKTTDPKVVLDVLLVLTKFIVGLLPFADYPLLAIDLKDAIQSKQKQMATTNNVLNDLDNFYFAVFNWCTITHVIMEQLENSFTEMAYSIYEQKIDPNIIETSAHRVKARFDTLRNKLSENLL